MMCVPLWNQDFLLEWRVSSVPVEEHRDELPFAWQTCC